MSRIVFSIMLLFATSAAADVRYFSAIRDVPIAPGFTESQNAIGFSADRGRLVMEQADGPASAQAVRDFYVASLPPLGWSLSPTADGALVFARGRERLTFDVSAASGRTRIRAQLVVQPAAMNGD
jgi:hypothetical protein